MRTERQPSSNLPHSAPAREGMRVGHDAGGGGRCVATALPDCLERYLEHRDHKEPDGTGGDHAGKDRGADRVAAEFGRTLRYDQRVDAQNKREGGRG